MTCNCPYLGVTRGQAVPGYQLAAHFGPPGRWGLLARILSSIYIAYSEENIGMELLDGNVP